MLPLKHSITSNQTSKKDVDHRVKFVLYQPWSYITTLSPRWQDLGLSLETPVEIPDGDRGRNAVRPRALIPEWPKTFPHLDALLFSFKGESLGTLSWTNKMTFSGGGK